MPGFFDSGVERVVFEVDYVAGAEPVTGAAGGIDDVWKVAEENTRAILGGVEIVRPRSLDDMTRIAEELPEQVTTDEILAVADRQRDEDDAADTRALYIVWLDSFFAVEGERRENVLAVSIGDTRVIGVLRAAFPRVERHVPGELQNLVEQVVLVHELGHAFGLVDRGIPRETVVLGYADRDNHHCPNPSCVMHQGAPHALVWVLDEAANDVDLVLFGEECLNDARRARE